MKFRSFISASAFLTTALVLVALPREAASTEPLFVGDEMFLQEGDGSQQLSEDPYGNSKCLGRCGGRPCCSTPIIVM